MSAQAPLTLSRRRRWQPSDAHRGAVAKGEEFLPQRVKDARSDGRHERSTSHGASAPSRAWPLCLPPTITPPERRHHAYWPTLLAARVVQMQADSKHGDVVVRVARDEPLQELVAQPRRRPV